MDELEDEKSGMLPTLAVMSSRLLSPVEEDVVVDGVLGEVSGWADVTASADEETASVGELAFSTLPEMIDVLVPLRGDVRGFLGDLPGDLWLKIEEEVSFLGDFGVVASLLVSFAIEGDDAVPTVVDECSLNSSF